VKTKFKTQDSLFLINTRRKLLAVKCYFPLNSILEKGSYFWASFVVWLKTVTISTTTRLNIVVCKKHRSVHIPSLFWE
jgi:hypothetical protein